MVHQLESEVGAFAYINPLPGIREAVNPRFSRRIFMDGIHGEGAITMIFKRHSFSPMAAIRRTSSAPTEKERVHPRLDEFPSVVKGGNHRGQSPGSAGKLESAGCCLHL